MGKKKGKGQLYIRSRTTKDPLKICNEIELKDGLRIQGKDGLRTKDHPPLNFQLIISRNDLHRLFYLLMYHPVYFVSGFLDKFIAPTLRYIDKGARGKYKGKGTTLFWLKAEASELYNLFSYLIKTGKRPRYFQRLLDEINKLENKEQFYKTESKGKTKSKQKPDPVALTAHCVNNILEKTGKACQDLGIKPFQIRIEQGDFDSFYAHYIKEYKPQFHFTADMSDSDLESLAEEQPFNYIFKILKLI